MGAGSFAKVITSKIRSAAGLVGMGYSGGTPPVCMNAVADGVTAYLLANTICDVRFVDSMTGAVTNDKVRLKGKVAPPPVSDGFDNWLKGLEANIISSLMLADKGEAGVQFPVNAFAVNGIGVSRDGNLKPIHTANNGKGNDPQTMVWTRICQGIIDWVNGPARNPATGPATMPGKSGVAQITRISVS